GGRMITISERIAPALPTPPEACEAEGLAEVGRSEWIFRVLANVSSYTPAGNMLLSFWPTDLFTTQGGNEEDLSFGLTSMRFEMCVKFR
ncbi:unnamed protein product, partial [Ostreobium quekettii]